MKIVSDLPHEIFEEENVWIPVTDDLKLAARIWRPKDSERRPVPAILEYIPYRKRFGSTERDEITHKYLAGHGYACVRLDIRGSGESEGVLTDEYLQSELDDGVAAIEWLAAQDWCDGTVGMMGISWGGFNALMIAAMHPEPLKAIVTVCSSDDRYADDIHHMGGTLLGDNLSWAGVMFSYNTMPPDPALVGDRWKRMWMERLEGSGLWLKKWLQHQRRDSYWRHGSVAECYEDIRIPVFAVSGWADGYTNTVFRLIENLDVPRKGLVGPWGHTYPHMGKPGPAIDFLGELLNWWDHWLKGEDRGMEKESRLCAYMQDSAPPNPQYEYRKGRWVIEKDWPSPDIEHRAFVFATCRRLIEEGSGTETEEIGLKVQSPATLGLLAGKWSSYANGPDLAGDQRSEDGGGLIFQTHELKEDIEILGQPVAELELASDQPIAMVAVRLSDFLPDHQITRVTYGLLNLTCRDSREHSEPLEPGRRYRVAVPLNHIAQRFPRGHRIRVSVSTVYWPLAWTPPECTRLTVYSAKSRILLPCRTKNVGGTPEAEFDPPVCAPPPRMTVCEPAVHRWLVHRDLAEQRSELEVIDDRGVFRFEDIGLTVGTHAVERYSVHTGDFTSVRGTTEWARTLERGDWKVKTRTFTCLTSDQDNFYLRAELDAYQGDTRVCCRSWDETIPRDHI